MAERYLATTGRQTLATRVGMPGHTNTGAYDVIVIGAGPAGCSAAIACIRHGLKVALIERMPFPRHRPGETLHPGIEPLLQQLGVAEKIRGEAFIRPAGTWVTWDKTRQFVPFGEDANGPWRGFQIPRATLDGFLLSRARALGVHVLQPCQAKTVLLEQDRVIGIRTQAGPLFCVHLVDASGAHGWLARQLGLVSHRYSPPLTAAYGYKRGTVEDSALGMFAEPSGWYWTAHIGQQLYHWTRLYFAQDKIPRATAVPASFEQLACEGKIQGADVTWRSLEKAAGNGYFIIGDAATLLDPGASHGVLKALMSGMMAAQCILDEQANPAHVQAISLHYRQWLQDWFDRDVQKMRELYAAHPFPPHWLGQPLEKRSTDSLAQHQQE
ncbi:FAD-dependent oxidoreductase [Pseudomonas fluorescens]|uniref:NAD(P)/FAD-dependent oxidoreductase n=2 Tax=Pseudomonas fluorescens TaxID=294 RepID=UPI001FD17486|nr:NAD(P)/FAD-dependent oxidoreductase [Pseudomonas fluorescens]